MPYSKSEIRRAPGQKECWKQGMKCFGIFQTKVVPIGSVAFVKLDTPRIVSSSTEV